MNTLHLKEFKQGAKLNAFPALRVQQSLYPVRFITGQFLITGVKDIENYLIENNFINNPYHYDNSAWEKQGVAFAHTVKLFYRIYY